MVTLFVRHEVDDYEAWRQVYDDFDETRREMGVVDHSVHRGEANPDMITITHKFEDMSTAKSFVASDELRQAMEEAGVKGQPEMWFTRDA
ncbi:MAG: antibiotic biosynthesis monooxygenase [Candidatus Promineifilaceae bacterium]|nr:antibiotic biosynthesis monooxygenase [Candidatus Promineifilaceae bacterium]